MIDKNKNKKFKQYTAEQVGSFQQLICLTSQNSVWSWDCVRQHAAQPARREKRRKGNGCNHLGMLVSNSRQ